MRKTTKFMCKTTPLRQLTPFKYDKIASILFQVKNAITNIYNKTV